MKVNSYNRLIALAALTGGEIARVTTRIIMQHSRRGIRLSRTHNTYLPPGLWGSSSGRQPWLGGPHISGRQSRYP